jgi:hypothetical protein
VAQRNPIEPTDLAAYVAGTPDPGGACGDQGLRDLSPGEIERRRCDLVVDRLRHHPGEPIPESWKRCPVCTGPGCWWCDETGRVHPWREEWLGDALASAEVPVCLAARLLLEGEGTEGQVNRFLLDVHRAASEFVESCVPFGKTSNDLLERYFPRPDRPKPSEGTADDG